MRKQIKVKIIYSVGYKCCLKKKINSHKLLLWLSTLKLNQCQSHFFQINLNQLLKVYEVQWFHFFVNGFKGLVNFNEKYFKFEVLQVNNHISLTIYSIYRYEYYRYCQRELAFISALLSKINNRGLYPPSVWMLLHNNETLQLFFWMLLWS